MRRKHVKRQSFSISKILISAIILGLVAIFYFNFHADNIFKSAEETYSQQQEIQSEPTIALSSTETITAPTPVVVYKTVVQECPSPTLTTTSATSNQFETQANQLKTALAKKDQEIQELKKKITYLQLELGRVEGVSLMYQMRAANCSLNYKPHL